MLTPLTHYVQPAGACCSRGCVRTRRNATAAALCGFAVMSTGNVSLCMATQKTARARLRDGTMGKHAHGSACADNVQ
jgi:hypothetical protein